MYNMKMVEINEKTNQIVNSDYCNEKEVVNGKKLGEKGVFNRYNDNCISAIRKSKETQNNQVKLDYYIMNVQLLDDDRVILERTFRHGR